MRSLDELYWGLARRRAYIEKRMPARLAFFARGRGI